MREFGGPTSLRCVEHRLPAIESTLRRADMPKRCRLIVDRPGEGAWNMAVDEAILECALADCAAVPTLRFYRWSEPTVSLGYFQSIKDCPEDLSSLPVVRRLTGGGAILHDQELTYSVIFPPGQWPRETNLQLVRDVHSVLVRLLHSDEPLAIHPGRAEQRGQEPFLCFQRRSSTDVVVGDDKILGSAQRSRRGGLLQHGSILLRKSRFAVQLAGLIDHGAMLHNGVVANSMFAGEDSETNLWAQRLTEEMTEALSGVWDLEMEPGELTASEMDRASIFRQTKYSQAAWNDRR